MVRFKISRGSRVDAGREPYDTRPAGVPDERSCSWHLGRLFLPYGIPGTMSFFSFTWLPLIQVDSAIPAFILHNSLGLHTLHHFSIVSAYYSCGR